LTLLFAAAAICGCRSNDHDNDYNSSRRTSGERMSANPNDYPARPTTGEVRQTGDGWNTGNVSNNDGMYGTNRDRMNRDSSMNHDSTWNRDTTSYRNDQNRDMNRGDINRNDTNRNDDVRTTDANARNMKFDEPSIVGCLIAVDDFEVRAATEAERRALPQSVLDYAKMLREQHEQHMAKTKDLASRMNVTASEISSKEKKEHEDKLTQLQGLPDREFAKAYVDAMVEGHQKVLNKIDEKLAPNAKSTELKEFLATTREHIQRHLDEGKRVQESLPR
jgi:putative membrane protein